jgi:hypothetical protein
VLSGPAAGEQLSPVVLGDFHVELLCRFLDSFPCPVTFCVTDPFDLVEAGNGVADVSGVG